jgi:hypothetical protein
MDATTYITRPIINLDHTSPARVTNYSFDEPPETSQNTFSLFYAGRNVLRYS